MTSDFYIKGKQATPESQLPVDICNRIVKQAQVLMPSLTNEQRLALFSEFSHGYCNCCGRKLGHFEVCNCVLDHIK